MSPPIVGFRIIFHNQDGKFHEGETLAGVVKFSVTESIAISRLEIRFMGMLIILWQKALVRNSAKSKVPLLDMCDSEQYLNQKLNLLTTCKLNKDHVLASPIFSPQEYTFPFSIQLPSSLPPTFTGDYGYVRYAALAEMCYHNDTSYPSSVDSFEDSMDEEEGTNIKYGKEFIVEKIVPLTNEAMEPRALTLSRQQNLIVLRLNDIRCNWELKRMGFVPGEFMEVWGKIENLGRIKVMKTRITFIQHVTYKSQKCHGNVICQRKKLVSKKKTSISPEECGFLRESIFVPLDLPPTNQNKGELINIKYSVKLTIVLQSPFKPMKSEMDVTIGTANADVKDSRDCEYASVEFVTDTYFE